MKYAIAIAILLIFWGVKQTDKEEKAILDQVEETSYQDHLRYEVNRKDRLDSRPIPKPIIIKERHRKGIEFDNSIQDAMNHYR